MHAFLVKVVNRSIYIYTFSESISYVKLDHTLYSIEYGIYFELSTLRMLCEGDMPAADFLCCMRVS